MPVLKYEKIYMELKNKIEKGHYPPRTMLPSEYELIGIYNCSRNTARRAIGRLADEGYVQSVHGKGVIVIYQERDSAPFDIGQIENLKEAAARLHKPYRTDVVRFSVITIDEDLSRETGFAAGQDVVYLLRVRYFDNRAFILDYKWFLK